MTVTTEHQGPASTHVELSEHVTSEDQAMMVRIVAHHVVPLSPDPTIARKVVEDSVHAFIEQDGHARPAAAQMAALLWEVGELCAHHGVDVASLDRHFGMAQNATQHAMQFVLARGLPTWKMRLLHREALALLKLLRRHVWNGWERAQVALTLQEPVNDIGLGLASVPSPHRQRVERLVTDAATTSEADVRLVRSTAAFPANVLDHPETVAGADPHEVVVPASWSIDQMGRICRGQTVVGPPAPLERMSAHADLVRRAAELLGDGTVEDDRMVVPCTDLLAHLVTMGNRDLADLVIAKHLEPMASLARRRRITIGELLLRWLERGVPTNQLARDLGIPPQTAHSRLQQARALFPDVIDDPMQRIELLVALRAALPRWRAEACQ